jgi:hypothetical protein
MEVTRATLLNMGFFSIRFYTYVECHINLILERKNFANKLTITSNK